jgi:dihydropteroate synthase
MAPMPDSFVSARTRPRRRLQPVTLAADATGEPLTFEGDFHVMGVVNVTPDSFSDGGDFFDHQTAIEHAGELVEQGADIVDIGGESTRPGADPVSLEDELQRVIPVVEAVAEGHDVRISIDTTKAEVARQAVEAGAGIVNDISGLGFDEAMAEAVADLDAALVLMHIQGTPETMQESIEYADLVDDIRAFFDERIERAVQAGVDRDKIILDPGIGFGKTVEQNYRLIRELDGFFDFDCPLLLGTSRKSFLGAILDKPPKERDWGTAATVACGLFAGADIVRVHDVEEMVDVARVTEAICGAR